MGYEDCAKRAKGGPVRNVGSSEHYLDYQHELPSLPEPGGNPDLPGRGPDEFGYHGYRLSRNVDDRRAPDDPTRTAPMPTRGMQGWLEDHAPWLFDENSLRENGRESFASHELPGFYETLPPLPGYTSVLYPNEPASVALTGQDQHFLDKYAEGGIVSKLTGALTTMQRHIPGKPDTVKLPGYGTVEAAPVKELMDSADSYMRSVGRPGAHHVDSFPAFDEGLARRIAQAYDEMQNNPADPAVKRSYEALLDETLAQYHSLKDTGIDFRFLKDGEADPYAKSPALGYADVVQNGKLHVFPTDQGYGTLNTDAGMDNPLLKRVGRIGDLNNATANDAFRAVHDVYGHFALGNPFFRHQGEDRAWYAHSRMYSDDAKPAMTSELRGQNNWLNFGPHAEFNRTASGADTIYADQKAGLMPDWTWKPEGYAEGGLVNGIIRAFHGSPHAFDRFDYSKIGTGEGNQTFGHGLYFAGNEDTAKRYRAMLSNNQLYLHGERVPFVGSGIGKDYGLDGVDSYPFEYALRNMKTDGTDPDKALAIAMDEYSHFRPDVLERARNAFLAAEPRVESDGHLYEVGIHAHPDELLDFDQRLSAQPRGAEVRSMIQPSIDKTLAVRERLLADGGRYDTLRKQFKPLTDAQRAEYSQPFDPNGRQAYSILQQQLGAIREGEKAPETSQTLLDRGIPGLQYLDQLSRKTGEGSHNYVTFSDDPIEIKRRYEEGGEVEGYGYAEGGFVKPLERALMSFRDVTKRTPQLAEAAQRIKAGDHTISREDYQRLIDQFKPVEPFAAVPDLASHDDMVNALAANKRDKLGQVDQYPEGHPVALRLDIPAYTNHGVWVPTIHDLPSSKVIAHDSHGMVDNPVFDVHAAKALNVAAGTAKSPFATINGALAHIGPEEALEQARAALHDPDWRQVGMDPERHSFFYDRHTQAPVVSANRALQVGPLVLAHKPVYGNPDDYKYAAGGMVNGIPSDAMPDDSLVDSSPDYEDEVPGADPATFFGERALHTLAPALGGVRKGWRGDSLAPDFKNALERKMWEDQHIGVDDAGNAFGEITDHRAELRLPDVLANAPQRRDYTGNLPGFLADSQAYRAQTGLQAANPVRTTLGRTLPHPDLYSLYPSLEDLPVNLRGDMQDWEYGALQPGLHGPQYMDLNRTLPHDVLLDTILHETQHGIQNIEGHPGGISVAEADKAVSQQRLAELGWKTAQRMREHLGNGLSQTDVANLPEFRLLQPTFRNRALITASSTPDAEFAKRYQETMRDSGAFKDKFSTYQNNLGEAQARNTGLRAHFDDWDRRNSFWRDTEDRQGEVRNYQDASGAVRPVWPSR